MPPRLRHHLAAPLTLLIAVLGLIWHPDESFVVAHAAQPASAAGSGCRLA